MTPKLKIPGIAPRVYVKLGVILIVDKDFDMVWYLY